MNYLSAAMCFSFLGFLSGNQPTWGFLCTRRGPLAPLLSEGSPVRQQDVEDRIFQPIKQARWRCWNILLEGLSSCPDRSPQPLRVHSNLEGKPHTLSIQNLGACQMSLWESWLAFPLQQHKKAEALTRGQMCALTHIISLLLWPLFGCKPASQSQCQEIAAVLRKNPREDEPGARRRRMTVFRYCTMTYAAGNMDFSLQNLKMLPCCTVIYQGKECELQQVTGLTRGRSS